MQGRIAKVVHSHGFGFILGPNGESIFFHRADLLGIDFHGLREGQLVDFFLPLKPREHMRRAVIVRPSRRARASAGGADALGTLTHM